MQESNILKNFTFYPDFIKNEQYGFINNGTFHSSLEWFMLKKSD